MESSIILYCPQCVDMMDSIAIESEDTGYYYCDNCRIEWKITRREDEEEEEDE